MTNPERTSVVRGAVVGAVVVFVVVGLAELGSRFLEPLVAPRVAMAPIDELLSEIVDRSNAELAGSADTGFVATDASSLGQWDREHRPEETPRLLALGDEAVLGLGVARTDTGLAVFERALLRARPDLEPGVFKVGTVGSGQVDQEILLRRLWTRVQPSVVMVLVNEANDIHDNLQIGRGRTVARALGPRPLVRLWLAGERRSHLAFFRLLELRELQRTIDEQVAAVERAREQRLGSATDQRSIHFVRTYGKRFEDDWSATAVVLERIIEFVTDRNATVVLVRVPSRPAVDDRAWRVIANEVCGETEGRIARSCGPLDRERTARQLERFASARGVLAIDPAPALRQAILAKEEVFAEDHGVFSQQGQLRFGEALADALSARLVGRSKQSSESKVELLAVSNSRVELSGFWPIEGPRGERFAWSKQRSEISLGGLEPGASFQMGLRVWTATTFRMKTVGGAPHELAPVEGEALFPEPIVADGDGVARVVIEAPIFRPLDRDPESPDQRELGIAVSHVTLRRVNGREEP